MLHLDAIKRNFGQRSNREEFKRGPTLRIKPGEMGDDGSDALVEVTHFCVKLKLPRFKNAEVEEILDNPLQAQSVLLDLHQHAFLYLTQRTRMIAQKEIGVSSDHSQRSFDFVGRRRKHERSLKHLALNKIVRMRLSHRILWRLCLCGTEIVQHRIPGKRRLDVRKIKDVNTELVGCCCLVLLLLQPRPDRTNME